MHGKRSLASTVSHLTNFSIRLLCLLTSFDNTVSRDEFGCKSNFQNIVQLAVGIRFSSIKNLQSHYARHFVPMLNGKHLRDKPPVSCISYHKKISYTNEQPSGYPERINLTRIPRDFTIYKQQKFNIQWEAQVTADFVKPIGRSTVLKQTRTTSLIILNGRRCIGPNTFVVWRSDVRFWLEIWRHLHLYFTTWNRRPLNVTYQ